MSTSLTSEALKSGAWYSVIRLASQVLSWIFTIYTARLLVPADFGLMAMAAIFTTQLDRFSEMGISVAIVQKNEVSQEELSSLFWFTCAIGVIFSIVTLMLVYPTVWVFNEPKIRNVTVLIAPLFIVGALGIVPLSVLRKEFKFKLIGTIDFVSMVLSSLVAIFMAWYGYGVYALVIGLIVLRGAKSVLLVFLSGWRPQYRFNLKEVRPFLGFGLQVIMSGVLLRSLESLDKLIIGRYFDTVLLGSYGYAMNLASIPTDKIWPVFNELLLSTLSRISNNDKKIEDIGLSTLRYFLYIITPLLLGGVAFGREIILGFLGNNWNGAIPFFRSFCFSQFFFLLGVYFSVINNSQRQAHRNLKYNFITATLVLLSVYFCAKIGQSYIIYPWVFVLPICVVCWIGVNLYVHHISFQRYLIVFFQGVLPGALIVIIVFLSCNFLIKDLVLSAHSAVILMIELFICFLMYLMYFLLFKFKDLKEIYTIMRR